MCGLRPVLPDRGLLVAADVLTLAPAPGVAPYLLVSPGAGVDGPELCVAGADRGPGPGEQGHLIISLNPDLEAAEGSSAVKTLDNCVRYSLYYFLFNLPK